MASSWREDQDRVLIQLTLHSWHAVKSLNVTWKGSVRRFPRRLSRSSKLIDAGYDAWVAYGTYKRQPHAWVIFGKRYLDPTFDQFGEDETTYIRAGRVTDPDYQRDYQI
jgi:hypothetical protein